MWKASAPGDQLPSEGETLAHECFLKQPPSQDFCDIQGTRSGLTACSSPERGTQEKKYWIIELLLSFLPRAPLLFMILCLVEVICFSSQCLLPSPPPTKYSGGEGSLGRRNQTNSSHSSQFVWPLEMFLRCSPCGGRLLLAWGRIRPNMTQCTQLSWYVLWPHNSTLKGKNQRGERGNKQETLKIPSHSYGSWASALLLKIIISKAKLSHVWYCKRRKDSQGAWKGCRACNGKSSLSHWAVLL